MPYSGVHAHTCMCPDIVLPAPRPPSPRLPHTHRCGAAAHTLLRGGGSLPMFSWCYKGGFVFS